MTLPTFISGETLAAADLNSIVTYLETAVVPGTSVNTNTVQGTTATIARTLASKVSDFVSVADYGALGLGADDTSKIQAAIADNPGARIYFPPTTTSGNAGYVVSATLTLAAGQILVGHQARSSQIVASASGFDVVQITSNNAGCENIGFNCASQRASGAYINLTSSSLSNAIRACYMNNAFCGIFVSGNAGITLIEDCEIRNMIPSTGIGIKISGGNDTYISRTIINGDSARSQFAGVWITNTGGVWISDTDIIECNNGLLLETVNSSDAVNFIFCSQLACDTSGTGGIVISPVSGTTIKSVFFTGCWSTNSLDYGVVFTGSGTTDGTQFVNHRCFNNGKHGIVVGTSANNFGFTLEGSVVAGNSLLANDTYPGVEIGANAQRFTIMGNRIGTAEGFNQTQSSGILVDAGPSDYYNISFNDLVGNGQALTNGATGTSQGIVRGNQGTMAPVTLTSSSTPYSNQFNQDGVILLNGGTVTAIEMNRGGVVVYFPSSAQQIPVCAGDLVQIGYTIFPTTTFLPT